MCHEQVFISFYLWGSVCSGFCILSHNGSPSLILSISCHMQGIFSAHLNFHSIYSLEEYLFCLICCVGCVVLFVYAFSWHKPFIIFYGFHDCFCALCASTLLAQANTCSLVISQVFVTSVNSWTFSIIVSSLFMKLINHSLRFLFLYTHIHLK